MGSTIESTEDPGSDIYHSQLNSSQPSASRECCILVPFFLAIGCSYYNLRKSIL